MSGKLPHREVLVEGACFALTLSACLIIVIAASQSMPAGSRPFEVAMQSVLSTALALPCGASWRSLRGAIRRRELSLAAGRDDLTKHTS